MSSGWDSVPIAQIATRVQRPESVDSTRTYCLLGAHWYAKGLYVKDEKPGAEIRASKLFAVRAGDFVYNRLFAWKGSFALAQEEHDGCFVSGEFPCFELDTERISPRFLWLHFSREAAWLQSLSLSTGSTPTSRNRLKEAQFLGMQVPLPPLDEQRRMVTRIDELAALIEEAQGLRAKAAEEAQKIMPAALADVFGRAEKQGWERRTVDEVLSFRDNGIWGPRAEDDRGGTYILRSTNFTNAGRISFEDVAYRLVDNNKAEQKRLAPGDILLERSGGSEKQAVGRVAFFDRADADYCFGNFVTRLRPDLSLVYPDFLFRMLWGLHATGETAPLQNRTTGMRNLRFKEYLQLRIPVPPPKEQQAIVTFLDALESDVEELIRLQNHTQTELEAMIPSILGKAFRGEL